MSDVLLQPSWGPGNFLIPFGINTPVLPSNLCLRLSFTKLGIGNLTAHSDSLEAHAISLVLSKPDSRQSYTRAIFEQTLNLTGLTPRELLRDHTYGDPFNAKECIRTRQRVERDCTYTPESEKCHKARQEAAEACAEDSDPCFTMDEACLRKLLSEDSPFDALAHAGDLAPFIGKRLM